MSKDFSGFQRDDSEFTEFWEERSKTQKTLAKIVLGLIVAIVVIFAFNIPAKAADGFNAPLSQAYTGAWFDPSQSGVGFDILTYDDPNTRGTAADISFFAGRVNGQPLWLQSQPQFSGGFPETAPLYASNVNLDGTPHPGDQLSIVGKLTVAPSTTGTCNELTVDITFDASGEYHGVPDRHYALKPLIQPFASQCQQCVNAFSPMPPGC